MKHAVAISYIPSFIKTVMLYFRVIFYIEYFVQFRSHNIHFYDDYTASRLRHVLTNIFGHHQVVHMYIHTQQQGILLYTYISSSCCDYHLCKSWKRTNKYVLIYAG
jgi:hypothetical protein